MADASPSFAASAAWPSLRLRLCADGTPAQQGCTYHSRVSTKCWEEAGTDGPVRRCKRTLEKFRDCGRGREEIEHLDEEVVDTNFQGGPAELKDHEQPFRPPEAVPHLSKPLDSQLGEAVEDILRYADELARATRRSGSESDTGRQQQPAEPHKEPAWSRWHTYGLPYLRQRHPVPPGSKDISPGRARAQRCWEEFREEFQEV